MTTFGYFLSSEEHGPKALVQQAQLAEASGFSSVFISDHFHPWLDEQGESPFVWSVIGAIGATTALEVTTGVTCPTMRTHPAVIAQAAATSSLGEVGSVPASSMLTAAPSAEAASPLNRTLLSGPAGITPACVMVPPCLSQRTYCFPVGAAGIPLVTM